MKKIMSMLLFLVAIPSASYALYDGSLNAGNDTPDDQGWLYIPNPFTGAQASNTATGGVTTLDTTAGNNVQAGYFTRDLFQISNYVHPLLDGVIMDRAAGYTVTFGLQVNSESHATTNRAGFSMIVLSNDLYGIELGFWENEIWAYSGLPYEQTLFNHAEGAVFNSTAAITDYDLVMQGNMYALYANNQMILNGFARDYSSHTDPLLGSHPYDIPNFIFFGDDTSSAQSEVSISYIGFIPTASVPEPSVLLLCLFGSGFLLKRKLKNN